MAELTKLVLGFAMEPHLVERIRREYPDLEVVVAATREELPEALHGAQALVGSKLTPELLAKAPDLGWFQTGGAGVDDVLFPALTEGSLILTTSSGVHADNIAEHILAMILGFARNFPHLLRSQVKREWDHFDGGVFEISGQTLAVIGLGHIGKALSWRADGLGMRVFGYRRRESDEIPQGVEKVYRGDQLHELLGLADHVAICLPHTPRTYQMFGADEFRAMKPSAYLYNIGRGPVIDQDALIDALKAGEIAGAGLDVTVPEPLPSDSPLWDMPNVVITAHTSGRTPRHWERGIEIVLANIGRYRRDEPLINLVDKLEGY